MNKTEVLKALGLPDATLGYQANPNSRLWGWNGDTPVFEELIREIRPKLIIEVGTWLGLSTATMANALKKEGLPETGIICVDTWLGSEVNWSDVESVRDLGLQFGFPTLYPRFLSNMVNEGTAGAIVPLPMTSAIAARFLKKKGIESELIYIDASHDEIDVYEDVKAYWDLLAPSGVMFGDDWPYESVQRAVQRFCEEKKLTLQAKGEKWRITKL